MRLTAGSFRELHWHEADEWAYMLYGNCRISVLNPDGTVFIGDLEKGDLWYFPRGHGHAIQTLGNEPCHAVLAFDDGLYGEHGTFGISDWMSRFDSAELAQVYGVDAAWLADRHALGSGTTAAVKAISDGTAALARFAAGIPT